ncbi:CYFA0S13e03444g1_1 [Cyberlindnera fabianii]|uniref:CYFA0S13e03444g1_1 n=1 Tax=Cyberlindnera fabianii TaxID=36022 RepID=A0A061B2S9_CYBFA|nr:CYFA0S13e03444g1_1 [Cyberlindnera fabianii]
MNFLKKFLGSSPKGELSMIPSGQLYLKRSPGSPKSATECLYADAAASIRETSAPHNYLLVVQRVYAEGEEQLKGDEDEDDDDFDESKDERVFLIDAALKLYRTNKSGAWSVSWSNIDGDEGEQFEFVVDESVSTADVDQFMNTIYACCFERKYQRSSAGVSKPQLEEFIFDQEAGTDKADDDDLVNGVKSLSFSAAGATSTGDSTKYAEDDDEYDDSSVYEDAEDTGDDIVNPIQNKPELTGVKAPAGTPLITSNAKLHIYDAADGVFRVQGDAVVSILDLGKWDYWLSVKTTEGLELGTQVTDELNSRFETSVNSFIFNYWVEQGAFTFLLKFDSLEELESFKEGFTQSYYEHNNQSKWVKMEPQDKEYALNTFELPAEDVEMADYYNDDEDDNEEDDDEEKDTVDTNIRTGLHKEAFSDSEDEDETLPSESFKGRNENLMVSFKNDRSYVTNGNRIGVFSTDADDELKFNTTIQNLTVDGKKFTPTKMMLHTEDRALVMQGAKKDTLYRMDLERGKIVDEWKVKEELPVVGFGPSAKFTQMTGEQTFLGISDKGLFRVDPRLNGDKLVDSDYKSYVTKNDFSSFGTTENGYIAVASNKGDVRLYDKLGIRAKSLLPALGDSIKHVEASADGKWLLCTCKTYLLLIDMTIKNGPNAGSLGFQKSFGKDGLPKMRTLRISPEHVQAMQESSGKPLDFTKAYFNTGLNVKEQTIVSASGPYAITWSMKAILRGDVDPYKIKRYTSNVVADNFKFGSDKKVIIALEDDIGMVNKRAFTKADRKSLAVRPGKKSFQ